MANYEQNSTKYTKRIDEPLLTEDNGRFTQLPLKYPLLQKSFEEHESMFWSAKEIDYSADLSDWECLSDQERFFIENILGFFAGADGIVLENLIKNFCIEVKAPEARNFYAFQGMIENVHAMTYALLLDTFVKNPKRKEELFNAIETIPAVEKKANWAIKWMNENRPFEERLLAFSIVEGIFFSASFASIFWLKSRNKMVKALGKSNEFISRDEGLHCVTPETMILTKSGYKQIIDCVNIDTEIWNGFEWSTVTPVKTGFNKEIVKVELDNGMELECTHEHKWLVVSNETKYRQQKYFNYVKKYTKELEVGDILMKYEMPIIDTIDSDLFKYPYTQGLFSADGSYDHTEKEDTKCPLIKFSKKEKKQLLTYINYKSYTDNESGYMTIRLHKSEIFDKFYVPINYSIKTKLSWLEGFVDGDGCLNWTDKKNKASIQISSINLSFIKNIQLMLTTLGCLTNVKATQIDRLVEIKGKMVHCKEIYVLYITCHDVIKLKILGFSPKRLNLDSVSCDKENKSFSRFIRIKNIISNNRISDTYCFTEEKNHTGIFNGIMTCQCDFAILLYQHLNNKVSQKRIEEIMKEAVDIEIEFITESIPCKLIGMNSDLMTQYIKYVADRHLVKLDFEKIYFEENPFDFMKAFSLEGKTNFFEARPTDYRHSSTAKAVEDSWDFSEDIEI